MSCWFLKGVFNRYETFLKKNLNGYENANTYTKQSFECAFIFFMVCALFLVLFAIFSFFPPLRDIFLYTPWLKFTIYFITAILLFVLVVSSLLGMILGISGFVEGFKREKKFLLPITAIMLNFTLFLALSLFLLSRMIP